MRNVPVVKLLPLKSKLPFYIQLCDAGTGTLQKSAGSLLGYTTKGH